MITTVIPARFPAGEIRITSAAASKLPPCEVLIGLVRHLSGDWGDLDQCDWRQNDAALEHGFRLLSRYVTPGGTLFWIITEHNRSATTILLPNDN